MVYTVSIVEDIQNYNSGLTQKFSTRPIQYATFQLEGSLADLVLELGYSFCNTVEECRSNLANFGVNSITPAAVAKVLGVMVRTHTGLPSEQVNKCSSFYMSPSLSFRYISPLLV